MDFLVVTKEPKYRIKFKKTNTKFYMKNVNHLICRTNDDIHHFPIPTDAYEACKEYDMPAISIFKETI